MNRDGSRLSFFSVEKQHYAIILEWFQKQHVQEYFYGQGLLNTLKNLELSMNGIHYNGLYSFQHWIAYFDTQPLGFLMTSTVEGPYNPENPYDKWYEEGKRTITLDLLIGAEEYLGRGLGHQMIREFLEDKFPEADRVLIDPVATNLRAIHVYEKAGFKKIEQFPQQHDEPHLCWMMILDLKQ